MLKQQKKTYQLAFSILDTVISTICVEAYSEEEAKLKAENAPLAWWNLTEENSIV